MPKRPEFLFDRIADFSALVAATRRAVRGKRRSPGAASFLAGMEKRCLRLERDLRSLCWRPGDYAVIHIKDPKPRRISAAPFRDRVVHHALCHEVEPIFERGFIHDSYANRCRSVAGVARSDQGFSDRSTLDPSSRKDTHHGDRQTCRVPWLRPGPARAAPAG